MLLDTMAGAAQSDIGQGKTAPQYAEPFFAAHKEREESNSFFAAERKILLYKFPVTL